MRLLGPVLGSISAALLASCSPGEYAGIDLNASLISAIDIETQDIAKRASIGDKNAQLLLARRYRDGLGVPVSKENACGLYAIAVRAQSRTQTTFICDGACQAETTHIGGYDKGIAEAADEAEALGCGLERYTPEKAKQRVTSAAELAAFDCGGAVGRLDRQGYKIAQPKCYPFLEERLRTITAFHVGLLGCEKTRRRHSGETLQHWTKRTRKCLFERPEVTLTRRQSDQVKSFASLVSNVVHCDGDSNEGGHECKIIPSADGKSVELAKPDIEWSLLAPIFDALLSARGVDNDTVRNRTTVYARRALELICNRGRLKRNTVDFRPGEWELCFLYRDATRPPPQKIDTVP